MDRSGNWIGGTDHGHIHGLPPYGCRRQLFYTKRGAAPDFKREVSLAMQRGTELEPNVAKRYAGVTGRSIRQMPPDGVRGVGAPDWLQGHPDYLIDPSGDQHGCGVLECKTAGEWVFKDFQNKGLPETYIMQLQHYLALTGFKWGAYAVLHPDSWDFIKFDVVRDQELIDMMLGSAKAFLATLDNDDAAPDRIEPADNRCKKCPWRVTCLGSAEPDTVEEGPRAKLMLDEHEELAGLLAKFREVDDIYQRADFTRKATRAKIAMLLKNDLNADKVVLKGVGRVNSSVTKSKRLDTTRLRAEEPAIAEKYLKESTSERLIITLFQE